MKIIKDNELTIQVDWEEKIMLDFLTDNSNTFITLTRDAAIELADALNGAVQENDKGVVGE